MNVNLQIALAEQNQSACVRVWVSRAILSAAYAIIEPSDQQAVCVERHGNPSLCV